VNGVLPTQGLVSSGGPTATLDIDVSRLPTQGCGTVFQTAFGKQTSAMNNEQFKRFAKDLFVWALRSWRIATISVYL